MEAPVKVIHRDLKSRNGNVVLCFYFNYFTMKYIRLVIEIVFLDLFMFFVSFVP